MGAEPVRGRPVTRNKRQQGPDLERLLDGGKEPRALWKEAETIERCEARVQLSLSLTTG